MHQFLRALAASLNEVRVDTSLPDASSRLSESISCRMSSLGADLFPRLAVVCIGTDRSTGDALGPLVGSYLVENYQCTGVFGTLDEPVHANNLDEVLSEINADTFVLAVDACLGKQENIGLVTVGSGSLKPGAGVNKILPSVGHMYVTGTVNVGGFMEYFVLQNTRLSLVVRMAKVISRGVWLSLNDRRMLNFEALR